MKKNRTLPVILLTAGLFALTAHAAVADQVDGKKEFAEHCASCHVNGGNIVNPAKTLKKADLDKNGVKSWQDIVAKMRNPGPGMQKFDTKDVSDQEAQAIAEYVLTAFK
jgi:cytochrome c6